MDAILNDIFKFKSPDFERLERYGFCKSGDCYVYEKTFLNGQMLAAITVRGGKIVTRVTDCDTGDEYALLTVEGACGEFVGKVRAEYGEILSDIAEKCFYQDVFKFSQTKQLIDFIDREYGDEMEFLWNDTPDCAVWRRKDNRKWYAVVMTVKKCKIGLEGEDRVDIVDFRAEEEVVSKLADGQKFFRAYHMNKRLWLTVCLDGRVNNDELFSMIKKSYDLADKSNGARKRR